MAEKRKAKDKTGDERLREQTAAMNQELMVAVVRQHELTEAAEKLNAELLAEITERSREAEEVLRRSEEQFRLILSGVQDYAIFMLSTTGEIVSWNEGAERMKGYSAREIIGKHFSVFYTKEDVLAGKPAKELEYAVSRGNYEENGLRVRKDGSTFWAHVIITALLDENEKLRGFSKLTRDDTQRNRAAAEIQENRGKLEELIKTSTAELKAKNVQLAVEIAERKHAEEEALRLQKLDSLRVLAGGIAHDLNNLMVGVMGNAGLALQMLPPGSPAREFVADIEKATEKVTNFSKQILSFTGKVAATKEPVQLNDVVKETAHFLIASISKTAGIEYSLSDDLPAIMADPQNMQQIVMNLMINASDAIGDNKGTIKVSTGKIRADRKYLDSLHPAGLPESKYVYIEVKDTGCGMSPKTRSRIFEPFYTTKFTGRGLGLSAVLGIVIAHGGAIGLETGEGCGATFRVVLPVPPEPVKVEEAKPVSEGVWSGKGTILFVDDEESSRSMGKRVLEMAGYTVLTAEDGVDAIDIFREKHDSISVVIMDLIMPRVRGDEAAKEMRKIREDTNILLLSGYHEVDLTELTRGPGKTAILGKPYKINKLLGEVQAFLPRAD